MLKLLIVLLLQPVWVVAAPTMFHLPLATAAPDSLILPNTIAAQKQVAKEKQGIALAVNAAGFAGSLHVLDNAWYNQFSKSSFHFFDDRKEWLQMDKAGHAWTAYHLSRSNTAMWSWAGADNKKALWAGCAATMLYTTAIEWLDGHSAKWGWSWTDMAANGAGSFVFAVQQSLWQEQKLSLKISVRPQRYTAGLQDRAIELFGNSTPERILKDYNSQTYWLSVNLKAFKKETTIPAWLSVAVGYGADGMWGGFANKSYNEKGVVNFDRSHIDRKRQWYLSPDIDLTQIKTNSKVVRTLLASFNCVKLPLPALMLDGGRLKFSALP